LRQVGYWGIYDPHGLRPGLMTTILLILVIGCAWSAVAVVAVGLCVLAARGDRTLRTGIAEPAAGRSSRSGTRLRLIA
jgi:hypothetical protein